MYPWTLSNTLKYLEYSRADTTGYLQIPAHSNYFHADLQHWCGHGAKCHVVCKISVWHFQHAQKLINIKFYASYTSLLDNSKKWAHGQQQCKNRWLKHLLWLTWQLYPQQLVSSCCTLSTSRKVTREKKIACKWKPLKKNQMVAMACMPPCWLMTEDYKDNFSPVLQKFWLNPHHWIEKCTLTCSKELFETNILQSGDKHGLSFLA